VAQLGLFGPYVRDEQTETTDLDVLVEFAPEARFGLLKFCELDNDLSDRLGLKVNLVIKAGLKPNIGKRILQEVIYL
jgi:predicted nucleotidyltransferase